jgi:hypothetical protein
VDIVQVLEPGMNNSKTDAELVREAVSHIPQEIMAIGGTLAQGQAMAEAMRLVLLGEDVAKVRQALERGHYPQYAINDLVEHICKSLSSLSPAT